MNKLLVSKGVTDSTALAYKCAQYIHEKRALATFARFAHRLMGLMGTIAMYVCRTTSMERASCLNCSSLIDDGEICFALQPSRRPRPRWTMKRGKGSGIVLCIDIMSETEISALLFVPFAAGVGMSFPSLSAESRLFDVALHPLLGLEIELLGSVADSERKIFRSLSLNLTARFQVLLTPSHFSVAVRIQNCTITVAAGASSSSPLPA